VADVKEILVQWDAGQGISAIGRSLGYTRPTVRRYVEAAQRAGLVRGGQRRREAGWHELAQTVVDQVVAIRSPSAASAEVARFHTYIGERLGPAAGPGVRLSVLHQRLRDEQGLEASWGTFYRYVRRHWPERGPPPRVSRAGKAALRLPDDAVAQPA
jgi:DNA-binding transcriptional regulator LsrR (DeoR family)